MTISRMVSLAQVTDKAGPSLKRSTAKGAALAAMALVVAGLPRAASAEPSASEAAPVVIVDTDMDFDDTAALAYLAEADRLGLIDLRAVTVETSGIAFAGNGLSHARCLLEKVGLPGIPVSDGDRTTANNFPFWARALLDGIVEPAVRTEPAVACPTLPTEGGAVRLLDSAIQNADQDVTLITLGPLSNVAEALAQDPGLAGKIGRLFLEGGQLDWSQFDPSSLDSHEYNLWTDAASAQAVIRALPGRVYMTSHQATAFVPLTEAFRQELLAHDTTPAADTVLTMASNPILMSGEAEQQGGAFWWDPLNAVAATTRGVVRYTPERIGVVQSGANEGRTFLDPDGTLVHYGYTANSDLFHQVFLSTLNGCGGCP
jgi:inosine-uridine nucleoside N-ribohydrolase